MKYVVSFKSLGGQCTARFKTLREARGYAMYKKNVMLFREKKISKTKYTLTFLNIGNSK